MDLFFDVIEGAAKGSRHKIKNGMSVGRLEGDLILNDSKVSSLHARVGKDDRGRFLLVDNNSSNGMFINGQRVGKATLLPGLTLQIGQTLLKVVEEGFGAFVLQPEKNWEEMLEEAFIKGETLVKQIDKGVSLFQPALKLTFIQGIQTDQIWELSYGPRHFGKASFEFPLFEPNCPDQCFVLAPLSPSEIEFQTRHPHKVLLNEQEKSSEKIKRGTLIRIGDTVIEIDFI